jgi:hypothetical protein
MLYKQLWCSHNPYMEQDDLSKEQQAKADAQADGYYGEDDMEMEDLDLSFLDEDEHRDEANPKV